MSEECTGLVRLKREAEIPRPRLERMLVAWALANIFLVVTMCGGLVAIRASAPVQAQDAGAAALKRAEEVRIPAYEAPRRDKILRRHFRCGSR